MGDRHIPPPLFISYSRDDADAYMQRFFADLTKEVAGLWGLPLAEIDKVAFIDTKSVKTATDWGTRIATAAAQETAGLVAFYSPRYFSKERFSEYCAKEFYAFIQRQKIPDYRDKDGAFRDVANIQPVLWYGLGDLKRVAELPPKVVKCIKFDFENVDDEINKAYQNQGLRSLARNRRKQAYVAVTKSLAGSIVNMAKNPLAPLDKVLEFNELKNAFWDAYETAVAEHVSPVAALAVDFAALLQTLGQHPGPDNLVTIERCLTEAEWTPYGDGRNIAALVGEVAIDLALRRSHLRVGPNNVGLALKSLASVSDSNPLAVLLVPQSYLGDAGRLDALLKQINDQKWRGGCFILPAGSASATKGVIDQARQTTKAFEVTHEDVLVREMTRTAAEFRREFGSLINEVLARVAKAGKIQRPSPDNEGPDKRPLMTNAVPVARDVSLPAQNP